MNDYISRSKLIAEYDRVHIGAAGGARKLMVEAPAEDVVPRAEVAREIFAEINNIKKEYARGDIDGNALYILLYMIEKKYTEEQK